MRGMAWICASLRLVRSSSEMFPLNMSSIILLQGASRGKRLLMTATCLESLRPQFRFARGKSVRRRMGQPGVFGEKRQLRVDVVRPISDRLLKFIDCLECLVLLRVAAAQEEMQIEPGPVAGRFRDQILGARKMGDRRLDAGWIVPESALSVFVQTVSHGIPKGGWGQGWQSALTKIAIDRDRERIVHRIVNRERDVIELFDGPDQIRRVDEDAQILGRIGLKGDDRYPHPLILPAPFILKKNFEIVWIPGLESTLEQAIRPPGMTARNLLRPKDDVFPPKRSRFLRFHRLGLSLRTAQ
jgi:hypothetical protein